MEMLDLARLVAFDCCHPAREVGVNKADLVETVRSAADLTRAEAEAAVDAMVSSIMDAVSSGERVTVAGFGTFNPSDRAARTGRNPQTGEAVRIAASKAVRFAPATAFKQALNPRAAKKAAAKKAGAKKGPAQKAAAQQAAAQKAAAEKSMVKKAPAQKAAAQQAAAQKAIVKRAPAQKAAAQKATAKKAPAKKAPAKKAAKATRKR
jgi:DNA-binding protein HU-beta